VIADEVDETLRELYLVTRPLLVDAICAAPISTVANSR
jgi:hypothetical protein